MMCVTGDAEQDVQDVASEDLGSEDLGSDDLGSEALGFEDREEDATELQAVLRRLTPEQMAENTQRAKRQKLLSRHPWAPRHAGINQGKH